MVNHYRFTKEAWKDRHVMGNLHFEHLVPLKIIKGELRNLIGTSFTELQIKNILHKTEIVVLTSEQAVKLDGLYKSNLPSNGKDRLEIMGFEIEPKTKGNSIFN
jgi:hypothetical protein